MIEDVALVQRRAPVDDPALFRTEPIVDRMVQSADVHAVHESRHSHKPGTDIVVDSLVRKVQPFALQIEFVRRASIMIAIPDVAGAEGVEAVLARGLEIASIPPSQVARTYYRLTFQGPVGIEL